MIETFEVPAYLRTLKGSDVDHEVQVSMLVALEVPDNPDEYDVMVLELPDRAGRKAFEALTPFCNNQTRIDVEYGSIALRRITP